MVSTQLNFDLDEEEERGTLGAPVFGSPPASLHERGLDFSQVTPSQFGISTQSFVPSSQGKDKSRVNQLKGRRRSTIGARGSPETNELIRYIAQQRLKTPPSTPGQTPTVTALHRSPFSQGLSSLKQKMASFQSLLEEEENQRPADERATLVGEKENRSPRGNPVPAAAPPSSKKRRTGPSRQVAKETREAACSALDTLSSLLTPVCPKQMDVRQAGSEEPSCTELRGCGTEEAVCHSPFRSPGPRSSGCKKVSFTPTYSSPEGQRTRFSQYRSPCVPLTLGPVDTSAWNEPLSLPCALLQTSHPAAAGEVSEKAGNSEQPKKKRVHFGVPLSPEFFDKRLPPSTPLQKGGTPAHLSGSGGSRLRSLLKTSRRSPLSLPQPDFNSPSLSGPSSPPPSGCQRNEMQAASTEEQEQISVSVAVADPADGKEASGSGEDAVCSPDVAPQALEETTRRESSSPDATPEPPGAPSAEVETGAEPMSELSPGPGHAPEPPSSTAGPARPRGRKRKVTETDSAAARRPSRNAAISASGKMKGSAGKRRWGNKAVDRSLYGKRDFASKNPGLSPITETLSSASRSPTPERRRAADRRAEDSREVCDPSMPLVQTMADAISAASLWRRRFGDPSSEQEASSRPEDCPVGQATGGNAPYDPDALPDGCEGQRGGRRGRPRPRRARGGRGGGRGVHSQRDQYQTPTSMERELQMGCPGVGNSALGDQREADCRLSNQQESDHFLSNGQERDCSPGERQETDCSPGDQEESDHRLSNHRESGCFSVDQQESDCHLSDHQESDGFSSDRPESQCFLSCHRESDGVTREGGGLDNARGEWSDGSAPEPEGLYTLPSGGGVWSSGSRRSSGATCRSKGRRSSLYRPRPEAEEPGEAPSPKRVLTPPCGEERAGERTEESRGVEICDTAAGREGRVGVGRPGIVLPAPPHAHEAGETAEALPPWHQVEFSIEDVLQNQPTRGCRSVRRSLRNQSHTDPLASGLAWVPCSPAAEGRSVRRRTRGRRSSTHAPPTLTEDPSL